MMAMSGPGMPTTDDMNTERDAQLGGDNWPDQFNDKRTRRLLGDFYDAVCSSGKFSWMGIFETQDKLKLPHVVIYLEEATARLPDAHSGHQPTDFVTPFAALSLKLRPQVFLDLYYRCQGDDSNRVRECEKDLALRYGPVQAGLLWKRVFPLR